MAPLTPFSLKWITVTFFFPSKPLPTGALTPHGSFSCTTKTRFAPRDTPTTIASGPMLESVSL